MDRIIVDSTDCTSYASPADIPLCFSHLKVLHINACRLYALGKFESLQGMNDEMRQNDIICVSETWFSTDTASSFNIPGYQHNFLCRESRPGGGISVFSRDELHIVHVDSKSYFSEDIQLLHLRIKTNTSFFSIILIYSNHRDHTADLASIISSYTQDQAFSTFSADPTVLLGDFNVNCLEACPSAHSFKFNLASFGFIPLITEVTRPASGTSLDHIWIRGSFATNSSLAGVVQTSVFSDHYPIFACLVLEPCHVPPSVGGHPEQPFRRVFSAYNYNQFANRLFNTDWGFLRQYEDPSVCLDVFESLLFSLYNSCFPLLPAKPPHRNTGRSPWFTPYLAALRDDLDRCSRLYFNNISSRSLKDSFYFKRNFYRRELRRVRREFDSRQISRVASQPSKLWRLINEATGRSKSKATAPSVIYNSAGTVTEPTAIANVFAEHFASVGVEMASTLPSSTSDIRQFLPQTPYLPEFSFSPASDLDFLLASRTLKATYKDAVKSVPSKIIRNCIFFLTEPLSIIFDLSIRVGVFPASLKLATVIPLFKGKGSRTDVNSYRPIALTSFIAKLFEKCLCRQVTCHLDSHNFFSDLQFGFRTGRSCEQAICSMIDIIACGWSSGNAVLGCFLDISKAFDCLDHFVLGKILSHFDFSPQCCSLILSFLGDRTITVSIGSAVSAPAIVRCGVGQGTVLGPLLFLIYINSVLDVANSIHGDVKALAFADDTSLFFTNCGSSVSEFCDFVSGSLDRILDVFDSLRLAVNTSKTGLVLFTPPRMLINFPESPIRLRHTYPQLHDAVVVLGVTLHRNLDWSPHTGNICDRLQRYVAIICRLRQLNFPLHIRLLVFRSLVQSVLIYCSSAYGSSFDYILNKLQVAQNNAVRAIFNLPPWAHISSHRSRHNILSVRAIARWRLGLLGHKCCFSTLPGTFSPEVSQRTLGLSTRASYSLRLTAPFSYCDYINRCPRHSIALYWNRLPQSLTVISSFKLFSSALKRYLLSS